MKIIAKIDDKRFIVEASGDELANVLGYSSEYYLPQGTDYNRSKLVVGQEIGVNEMYQACQSVKDSSAEIQEAIKTHKRLVTNMEKFSKAIVPAAAIIASKEPKK